MPTMLNALLVCMSSFMFPAVLLPVFQPLAPFELVVSPWVAVGVLGLLLSVFELVFVVVVLPPLPELLFEPLPFDVLFVTVPLLLALPVWLVSAAAMPASESVIAARTAATTVLRVFTFTPFLPSIVMGKAQRL